MRRMWAAGAAIVVCLALGGIPVVAQSPSPGPTATPSTPTGPALVTGMRQCAGTFSSTSVDGVQLGQMPDLTCTNTMSDPRITGPGTAVFNGACYPPNGCVYWGTYHIDGPDGAWDGTWNGTDDKDLGKAVFMGFLGGTGAYQGWTFAVVMLDDFSGVPQPLSGLIYQGPPPPWEPLPLPVSPPPPSSPSTAP
jgi:hypothetical protein